MRVLFVLGDVFTFCVFLLCVGFVRVLFCLCCILFRSVCVCVLNCYSCVLTNFYLCSCVFMCVGFLVDQFGSYDEAHAALNALIQDVCVLSPVGVPVPCRCSALNLLTRPCHCTPWLSEELCRGS